MSAMALNLRRWRQAAATHDVENPGHDPAYGIGLSHYDRERLGLELGEELWDGVTVHEISIGAGQFRVMCNGEHDECNIEDKETREAADKTIEIVTGRPLVTA